MVLAIKMFDMRNFGESNIDNRTVLMNSDLFFLLSSFFFVKLYFHFEFNFSTFLFRNQCPKFGQIIGLR